MAKNDWSDPEWGTDGELSKPTARVVSNTKYGLASGMDTMSMLKAMAEDYYTPRRPDDAVSGIRPAIVIHAEIMQLGDVPDPVLKDMIDLLGKDTSMNDVLVVYAAPAGGTSSMLPTPKNENDLAAKIRYPRFYSFTNDNNAATTLLAEIGKPCNVEITDKVTNAFGVYHGMSQTDLPSLTAGATLYRAAGEGLVAGSFYDPKQRIDRVANLAGVPGGSLFGIDLPFDPNLKVYPPRSPECVALFENAARVAGLPVEWARDSGLHNILRRESGGRVGIPNFTYGKDNAGRRFGTNTRSKSENFIHRRTDVWPAIHDELKSGRKSAKSTATGLGQLILDNTEAYYPSGRQGIGNALEEAIGMLKYIARRYKNPARAWKLYGTKFKGY
jgi:hypothetical protein